MIGIRAALAQHLVMIRPYAIAAAALALAILPVRAAVEPVGVYQCIDLDGEAFGILSMAAGGDYDFVSARDIGGSGRIAVSGYNVEALSGPLADIDLKGSFVIDLHGNAFFMLGAAVGGLMCAVPAP